MRPADRSDARTRAVRLKSVLVPVLFLVLGVAIGVGGTVAVGGGHSSSSGSAATRPAASPAAPAVTPSARTIVVPDSCERGMARAQAAMQTLGQAGQALGNLDSARLQALLNQLQQAQSDVDRLAGECRRQARTAN